MTNDPDATWNYDPADEPRRETQWRYPNDPAAERMLHCEWCGAVVDDATGKELCPTCEILSEVQGATAYNAVSSLIEELEKLRDRKHPYSREIGRDEWRQLLGRILAKRRI